MAKRRAARRIMAELKAAYLALDQAEPAGGGWDNVSQAAGVYEGLKQAYVILTGRPADEVASEVVSWYIRSGEYQGEIT